MKRHFGFSHTFSGICSGYNIAKQFYFTNRSLIWRFLFICQLSSRFWVDSSNSTYILNACQLTIIKHTYAWNERVHCIRFRIGQRFIEINLFHVIISYKHTQKSWLNPYNECNVYGCVCLKNGYVSHEQRSYTFEPYPIPIFKVWTVPY